SARAFTASLPFDHRLWPHDLDGSVAWARALAKGGVLSEAEMDAILRGLAAVREELETGVFPYRIELEDIHMNIERRLIEKIGAVGGKLHTGRSRNDQIALDMRLWLRGEIDAIRRALRDVQAALVEQADRHRACPMPGYTHLQRAQPVLLAHHLLAYVFMLARDRDRLAAARRPLHVAPPARRVPAGRGRARGHDRPRRPPRPGAGPGVPDRLGKQHGRRLGSRLRPRVLRGVGDRGHPPVAARGGDRAMGFSRVRLRRP